MTTRITRFGLGAAAAFTVGIGAYALAQSSQSGAPFMHMREGMMPSMRHGRMGGGDDSTTMAEMGVIHELFVNHDRITRTVTNLPDGIRTVTESHDPRIAQLLKDHVGSMRQRVDTGNDPGLPIESEALRTIFKNDDTIETTVETTETGVVVVQRSTDAATVAALQQHAAEVTDFVEEGMGALHPAMMRNGRDVMRQVHDGMMHGGPNREAAPDAR